MQIILVLCMAATLAVVVIGVIAMAINGKLNKNHSNKLMRLRVLFQAIAILVFVIIVWLARNQTIQRLEKISNIQYKLKIMGIHFNHKSKAGDRKMQKELKLKMKAEERKKKRQEQERLKQEEEMRKLEELTRPDKSSD